MAYRCILGHGWCDGCGECQPEEEEEKKCLEEEKEADKCEEE